MLLEFLDKTIDNRLEANYSIKFSARGVPLRASLSKVLPEDGQQVVHHVETSTSLAGQSLLSKLFGMLSGDLQDRIHILIALLNEESMLSGMLDNESETTLSQMAELIAQWVPSFGAALLHADAFYSELSIADVKKRLSQYVPALNGLVHC